MAKAGRAITDGTDRKGGHVANDDRREQGERDAKVTIVANT